MAWEHTAWACGHTGAMQLYGKGTQRQSRITYEAGRKCMACWLMDQWAGQGDARAARPDALKLAAAIAEGKGIRISLPEPVAVQ